MENIDDQKSPPCGHIFNYNPLSQVCQCVFYDQNCELENSDIVGDGVYKLTKNNMERNLGNSKCPPKFAQFDHTVFICFYSEEQDRPYRQECEILRTYFNKDTEIHFWEENIGNSTDYDALKKNLLDFVSQKSDGRVTIAIFCHETNTHMCNVPLETIFSSIVLPIRSITKQFLIIDASCKSTRHKDFYEKHTTRKGMNTKNPDFEIYMYGACVNSNSINVIDGLSNLFLANPFVDFILGRFWYKNELDDKKMIITDFVKTVSEVTKFSDLKHIFENYHIIGTKCYSYHIEILLPSSTTDILLKSWFKKFTATPVVRMLCYDPAKFEIKIGNFQHYCIAQHTLLEPIFGKDFDRKYHIIDSNTFALINVLDDSIKIDERKRGRVVYSPATLNYKQTNFVVIEFSKEQYETVLTSENDWKTKQYIMIEIHLSQK